MTDPFDPRLALLLTAEPASPGHGARFLAVVLLWALALGTWAWLG